MTAKLCTKPTASHKRKRQITNKTKIRERATQTCTKTLSQNSHKYATYGHKGKGSYRRPHTHSLNALVKRKNPRVSQIHECRTIVPGMSKKCVAPYALPMTLDWSSDPAHNMPRILPNQSKVEKPTNETPTKRSSHSKQIISASKKQSR